MCIKHLELDWSRRIQYWANCLCQTLYSLTEKTTTCDVHGQNGNLLIKN